MKNSKPHTHATFSFRTANSSLVFQSAQFTIRAINVMAVFATLAVMCLHASAQDDRSAKDEVPATGVIATTTSEPLLLWSNGNVLPGELIKATPTNLFWKSDLFSDDLEVDSTALDAIRFPRNESHQATTEKYLVRTTAGDKLYGNISKLDERGLDFHSPRHGKLTIARDRIAKIVNLENAGYVLMEVTDLKNWESFNNTKKHWKISDVGELSSTKNDTNLGYPTDLPDAVQIDLTIKWEKKLDFVFGLGVPANSEFVKSLPCIESWSDSVVLKHEDDFEVVMESLDETQRRLALQIQWDRKTNEIVIRGENGEVLCPATKIKAPVNGIMPGVFLANKTGDLTIETLQISKIVAGYDSSKTGIQTVDGTIQYGEIQTFDGKNWTVGTTDDSNKEERESKTPTGATESQDVLAKTFRSAILNLQGSEVPKGSNALVRFQDGAILVGELLSIADGNITLQTAFSATPVSSQFDGASVVRFLASSEQKKAINLAGKHRLSTRYGALLGQVSAGSGKPNDVIRWQPVGCKTGVPLADGDARIVLSDNKKKTAARKGNSPWPDTIYFKNKDVVPCRIVSIDDGQVVFESFAEKDRVSHDLVKAVDLSAVGFAAVGFAGVVSSNDPGWFFSDASKQKVGEAEDASAAVEVTGPYEITICGEGSFGHVGLAADRTLKFDLEWSEGGIVAFKIHLFTDSEKDFISKTTVGIVLKGTILAVRSLQNHPTDGKQQIELPDRKAQITMKVKGERLMVGVNGQEQCSIKINPKDIEGAGVAMNLSFLRDPKITRIKLKNVSIGEAQVGLGCSNSVVGPEKLEQLLTIPRLRKDNPPKHVLCGRNIDFLRGELFSLDNDKVKFESRLDDFTFDRKLVSSIVWLHAKTPAQLAKEKKQLDEKNEVNRDEAKPGKSGDAQVVQVLLRDGRRITFNAKKWTDKAFDGISDALGTCSIPIADIQELRMGKAATDAMDVAYANWITKPAPAPKFESASESGGSGPGKGSSLVGTQAKDFKVKLLDGSEFKLSDHRGKVVVLDFWATWCGPCVRAMPDMIKATESFDPDEVVFIAVNQQEEPGLIELFLKRKAWDLKVGLDSGFVAGLFNVNGIPQSVIIDKDGKIAFLAVGAKPDLKNKITKAIQDVLSEGSLQETKEPVAHDLPANVGNESQ